MKRIQVIISIDRGLPISLQLTKKHSSLVCDWEEMLNKMRGFLSPKLGQSIRYMCLPTKYSHPSEVDGKSTKKPTLEFLPILQNKRKSKRVHSSCLKSGFRGWHRPPLFWLHTNVTELPIFPCNSTTVQLQVPRQKETWSTDGQKPLPIVRRLKDSETADFWLVC